jgi:hypothetical protein
LIAKELVGFARAASRGGSLSQSWAFHPPETTRWVTGRLGIPGMRARAFDRPVRSDISTIAATAAAR